MNRFEAISLLKEKITDDKLLKHCLDVGAIMGGVASELGEDPQEWETCGILHDIDFQQCKDDYKQHCFLAQEILKGKVSDEILKAIMAHGFEHTGVEPKSKMDNALIASDSVSGLVIATALVYPSKKLEDVKLKSVKKRFKEKDFARACRRELILYCEKIGLEKEKFFEIALESLKKIHEELSL